MAKSSSRSPKSANRQTLAQIVAQRRGTTQIGSNIGSNQMLETLLSSPAYSGATPVVQQMMLGDLLSRLPEDETSSTVKAYINRLLG